MSLRDLEPGYLPGQRANPAQLAEVVADYTATGAGMDDPPDREISFNAHQREMGLLISTLRRVYNGNCGQMFVAELIKGLEQRR